MQATSRFRPRRKVALLAAAVMATSLLSLAATGAQQAAEGDPRVIDPDDPCSVPSPPVPFADRDEIAEVHRPSVDCAFAQGITHGTGDNTYRPRAGVRRDQMASFIVRTLQAAGGIDIPAPSDQGFTDVSGNTHEDAINQLAALGIAQGRTPSTYAPREPVRRDQMASFIMRAADVAFGTTFEAVGGPYFADVPAANVHRSNVDAAFEVFGLTVGQSGAAFAPGSSVRRDQMATFLIRLLDVTELTDESAGIAGTGLLPDLLPEDIDVPGAEVLDEVTDVLADVEPLEEVTGVRRDAPLPGIDAPPGGGDASLPGDSPQPDDDGTGPSGVGGVVDRLLP